MRGWGAYWMQRLGRPQSSAQTTILPLALCSKQKRAGIRVPEQLSIVGFDDLELSAHLHPPLTTVRVPDQEMGEEIGRFIVAYLEGETVHDLPLFAAELVVRASAGPPPLIKSPLGDGSRSRRSIARVA